MNDELDSIESEMKEKDQEEKKAHHKVSGRSVFELKKVITKKTEKESRKEKLE